MAGMWFKWWQGIKREKLNYTQDDLIEIEKGSEDICTDVNTQKTAIPSQERQLMMETDMLHLCYSLSVSTRGFEKSIEQWFQDLDKYISNYERLLYSSISNYIYGLDEEKYASFEMNIYSVFQYVMNQDPPNENPGKDAYEKRRRIVMKFYDHVNLAHRQFVLYSQKQADVEVLIEKKIEPELAKSSKELTSQLVGLVAIFTALSFIVFGGISSLESLFFVLSQNDNSVLATIIVAIAWAFCLMNLLFAFMYFVLRIIGKKPDVAEKEGTMVQKYPLVFISNYILLSAFLLSLGSWAAQTTGVGKEIYDYVLLHGDISFIVGIIIIVVIIGGLGFWLVRTIKKSKHK